MTDTKVKSKNSYFHEFLNGSGIKVNCFINNEPVQWHLKYTRELKDTQEMEVVVSKYSVDSVMDTPIGGIPCISTKEKKEFTMTLKQYREFIVRFWENGHEYYDII